MCFLDGEGVEIDQADHVVSWASDLTYIKLRSSQVNKLTKAILF